MNYLVWVNALVCLIICVRVLTYTRAHDARHRPFMAAMAYSLVVATGLVVIRVIFGRYVALDMSELVLNIVLCVVVCAARGNLSAMLKPWQPWNGQNRRGDSERRFMP